MTSETMPSGSLSVSSRLLPIGPQLTMHLEYTGELWSKKVLGKILDDEVRRSTAALAELLNEPPRH